MSHPATNIEIDDLLASIRRIVSSNAHTHHAVAATNPNSTVRPPTAKDRFVLTHAFRVTEQDDSPLDDRPKPENYSTATQPREAVNDSDSDACKTSTPDTDHSDQDPNWQALETTIAELEAAVAGQTTYPDDQDDTTALQPNILTEPTARPNPIATHAIDDAPVARTDRNAALATNDKGQHNQAEITFRHAKPEQLIQESREKTPDSLTEGLHTSDDITAKGAKPSDISTQNLDADTHQPEGSNAEHKAAQVSLTKHTLNDQALGKWPQGKEMPVGTSLWRDDRRAASYVTPPRQSNIDPAAKLDFALRRAQDRIAGIVANPTQHRKDDSVELDKDVVGVSSSTAMTEVAIVTDHSSDTRHTGAINPGELRKIVIDTVEKELLGTLGERITRNVRKLVLREIHRTLASQELT